MIASIPAHALGPRLRIAPGLTSKLNLCTDLSLIAAAIFTAKWGHGGLHDADVRPLLWLCGALISVWVVTSAALRHYAMTAYERSVMDEVAMLSTQVSAVATVLAFIEAFAPAGTALPPLTLAMPLLWAPAVLLRLLVFKRIAGREEPVEEVLIVGVGPVARLTAQDMRNNGSHRVVGHLQFEDETGRDLELLRRSYEVEGVPCLTLGKATRLEAVLHELPVSEVYLAGNVRRHGEEMQEAIRVCEKLGTPFALPASAFRLERAQASDVHAVADGYLHYQSTSVTPSQLSLKRLFDIIASATALWLLLPLLTTVAVIIRLTSRGPVFFKQSRVGLHGRPFHMLKFRSMVINAEALKATLLKTNEQSGPVFKMKRDPRVTAIGRFIRKYSIDELPQLINVLRGDMSIVGPRPPVPEEVARYEAWQRRRLSVRPGLTCIWQVSGRNQISFEEWMVLDMQYIDHWSLAGDFNLIFRTVPVVITGRGAS